jgi:hypothetical protein
MQPRAKVTRLSTALDLDMTGVVEETARLVLDQVGQVIAEQTMPALAQILEAVKQARVVLDPVEAQAALDRAVPRGYLYHGSGEAVVPGHLAQTLYVELTRAGYGLVPISPQTVDSRITPERPRLEFEPTGHNEVTVHRVPEQIGTPNLAPGERVPAHGLEYRPDLLRADGQRDELEGWTKDLRS